MKPGGAPGESGQWFVNLGLILVLGGMVLGIGGYCIVWLAACVEVGRALPAGPAACAAFLDGIVQGRTPADAWTRAASYAFPPSWAFAVVVGALLSIAGVARPIVRRVRPRRPRREPDARWARVQDERRLVVPADPSKRRHRVVAGRSTLTRRCLAGEDCVSAVVFGPNGSGKTAGLIVPNTLEWRGSVVMTTAKSQDLDAVIGSRASLGPVWVVAPAGVPGIEPASWSPVDYATDADAADRMAGWLVDSSGMTGDPRARPWNAQARKYLKGLLLAARESERGMRGFIEWAYDGELASDAVCQVLAEHGHVEVMREYRSTWRIHEEGKGSVMFTAFGLADTYNRPGVLASSLRSDFTAPDLFGARPATVLLVTPQSEVERFTPYFTALISSIVYEAEQQAASTGGPVDPRLLLALDEAGNVFRYPRLPHLLTTARGNGVQLLLAYHDIAQIEHLYGGRDVARTILSNAKLRLLLPGVGDVETLRYFSDLLGHAKVSVSSRQTGPDGRRSRSESDHREPLAPLHLLQQLPAAQGVLLYENLPPSHIRLRLWFEDKRLRSLAATPHPAELVAGMGS